MASREISRALKSGKAGATAKKLAMEFLQGFQIVAEQAAEEAFAKKVQRFASGMGWGAGGRIRPRVPMKRVCPAPGCSKMGSPRHGMMCLDHKGMDAGRKHKLREAAKAEGGKWYELLNAKQAAEQAPKKRGRKKKAA